MEYLLTQENIADLAELQKIVSETTFEEFEKKYLADARVIDNYLIDFDFKSLTATINRTEKYLCGTIDIWDIESLLTTIKVADVSFKTSLSVEEFDAKWGDDVDRYALSEEKEKEFVEDAFNMYEDGGFSPTFHTPFEDRADMNGVAFQVIGRATTEECDLELLPMWKIEFEDGTEEYAYPCEITEIERKNLNLAQNLHKEDVKPNAENTMNEEIKINENIKIIVNAFDKEFGERTFNEILGCAKSNTDGLLLVRDVDDFNNNEIACEVEYKGLNFKVEFVNGGIITEVQITPRQKWEMARENAIRLWNTLNDSCFVEITPKYVKFFKSENGHFFACYEYPPLAVLKKDMTFNNEIEECMAESNMLTEQMQADLKEWRKNDCDLPPFPISVILHSEYQNYKFTEWE